MIMKIFLCIGIVPLLAIASIAFDCNEYSCKSNHTLCKYPNPEPSPACGWVFSTGFTDEEKAKILQQHNDLRVYVAAGLEKRGVSGPQPPASNMKTLIWDDGLAEVAQRWANQCEFGHDQCRNDASDGYVGQNSAWSQWFNEAGIRFEQLVQSWYDEVKDFDRNQISQLTGENFGQVAHYTQIVWANTDRIGCGKIEYNMPHSPWTTLYLVCNYGPGGNIIDEPIYEIRQL
ncbi:venom allergen 3-like [Ceratina calcarata]|uniref:Venom allergen 3-like n=1 Tax=Ceratina calcarata TaxID=156304 RepID=A0AAJ7J739_9HYME|nr:venom allergen 3-like [Ceratina calcarata]